MRFRFGFVCQIENLSFFSTFPLFFLAFSFSCDSQKYRAILLSRAVVMEIEPEKKLNRHGSIIYRSYQHFINEN